MPQLTQLLRNTLIRTVGSLYRLVDFIRQFFSQIGRGIGRFLNWSQEGYFLENDDSQSIKRLDSRPSTAVSTSAQQSSAEPKASSSVGAGSGKRMTRRRPGQEMNSFRNMARQIRNS